MGFFQWLGLLGACDILEMNNYYLYFSICYPKVFTLSCLSNDKRSILGALCWLSIRWGGWIGKNSRKSHHVHLSLRKNTAPHVGELCGTPDPVNSLFFLPPLARDPIYPYPTQNICNSLFNRWLRVYGPSAAILTCIVQILFSTVYDTGRPHTFTMGAFCCYSIVASHCVEIGCHGFKLNKIGPPAWYI